MENKIISIDICPGMDEEVNENAGVMWEHNATSLVFNIDPSYVDDYRYYIEYRSLIGTKVRTEYLELNTATNTVTYDIPVTMTSLRGVECYFNIVKIDEDGQTVQVIKPKKFCLQFDYSPDTDNELAKVNDFSINALLEAIRLGTFQGGSGGITVVDSKMSDTSSNPIQNKIVKAYVDRIADDAVKLMDKKDQDAVNSVVKYVEDNFVSKEDEIVNITISSVTESTEDSGNNVVTFSDGKTLTIKNGSKGSQGDKGADGKDYDYIESYVKTEADGLVDKIIEAQSGRTFTFAAISDLHYGSYGYYDGITDYPDGVKHACQALKYIDERIKLDAVAVLGDYTDGMAASQQDTAVYDFKEVNAVLDKLRFAPNLRLQGNHDFIAEHSPIAYRYIGAYSDENVEWDNFLGGYFFKDFNTQKLRVICLNTNEQNNTSISPTTAQYKWFINSLDLSTKENANQWQILILSHIPLDFWTNNGDYKFAYILNAYKTSGTWTDGDEVSCDFSKGNNLATIIGNIHGHTHNFKVDKLYLGNIEDSTTQIDVWRMATPNACFGAENKNYTGYQEDSSYTKTANSSNDTAFCVYCIDLDNYTIKAICYGAGYDRELNYESGTVAETYSISNILTNVTNSNPVKNVNVGASYSAELTTSGTITSVIITMGGVDITSTVYSNGIITIDEVTGNVVITAVAEVETEEPETLVNVLKTSTGMDDSIYNGVGYKENTRYSTSTDAETTHDSLYLSGYIEIKNGQTVRMKNVNFKNSNNTVVYFNNKGEHEVKRDYGSVKGAVYDNDGNMTQFTTEDYKYMRIISSGFDETSIITINQVIES